jgi:hypothetical protein
MRTSENASSTHFGEWDEWRVCRQRAPTLTFTHLCRLPLKNLKSTNLAYLAPAGVFVSLSGALRARTLGSGEALVMRLRISRRRPMLFGLWHYVVIQTSAIR